MAFNLSPRGTNNSKTGHGLPGGMIRTASPLNQAKKVVDSAFRPRLVDNYSTGSVLRVPSMINEGDVEIIHQFDTTKKPLTSLINKKGTPEEIEADKRLVNWYSHPATLEKFEKNTRLDRRRLTDMVAKGLQVPAFVDTKNNFVPEGAEAVYFSPNMSSDHILPNNTSNKKGHIEYQPQGKDINYGSGIQYATDVHGTLQHERAHAMKADAVLAPALYRALGQKLPKEYGNKLSYMNRPEEVYANFHNLRVDMGYKPGQKTTVEEFKKKYSGNKRVQGNRFFQKFGTDKSGQQSDKEIAKIVNAINTVATTGDKKENKLQFSGDKNSSYA